MTSESDVWQWTKENNFLAYPKWIDPIDYSCAVKLLEDRYLIELEKTAKLTKAVEEDLADVDLSKIRLYTRTSDKNWKDKKINYANSKQKKR